jgi:hypothetical protein
VTPRDYEVAMYAQAVWRLAHSSDSMELLAVACSVRNMVVPSPLSSRQPYASYSAACEDYLANFPTRGLPTLTDDEFVLPPDGLLCVIGGVYDCTIRDVTSTQDNPHGARWFARVTALPTNHWLQNVIKTAPLIGTFGSMQFFA